MDLSQIVDFSLSYAKWLGLALLAAGIGIRVFGQAIGRALFYGGALAVVALAYREWQALHSLAIAGGILLAGLVVFGLLAWTVRGVSFIIALALVAAAFYLLAYGWLGPSFTSTLTGALGWAGATILTMIVSGLKGRWLRHVPTAVAAAGLVR